MISPHLYIGIDVSKFKHDVVVINDRKQTVTPCFVIKENATGYQSLLDRLETIRQQLAISQLQIGLEATGDYWKNLYYFLQSRTAWPVTVINPVQTRRFAQSHLRRAVTDPIDALEIARYMQERKPDPTPPQTFGLLVVKDIDKQMLSLIKERNANICRLRLELGKTFPELEQQSPSLTAQRVLVLLKHYPTAEMVHLANEDQLRQLTYGIKKQHLPSTFVSRVKLLAQNSIACKSGLGAGIVVQTLALRILEIQAHLDQLKKELIKVHHKIAGKPSILTTIPGVASLTAAILEAYIGDVKRFPNYNQIVAYFGMNPTICSSGVSKAKKGHLQKKGNARVRNILFMNALSLIRFKEEPFYGFYQQKVAEGKPKLVAVTAIMRKLLVVVYEMLKKNEPFHVK